MAGGIQLLQTAFGTAGAFARARLLRRRVPFLVSWNLTFHCNLRCTYCYSPYLKYPEMKTPELLAGIDEMYALGMRYVTFSGGEPLLRNDIGEIVRHCKQRGITTFISTNGALLPRRIDQIAGVDRLTISLDGPAAVHDAVRGEGAFDAAIAAVRLARGRGIPVALTCVLSRHNLEATDAVLAIAAEHGSMVMFQPATLWLDSSDKPNPIAPEPEAYRAVVRHLIDRKRAGAPITNSLAGLRLLLHWPEPVRIRSTAGMITCTVEPDGKVLSSHLTQAGSLGSVRRNGKTLAEEFASARPLEYTDQPWCGPILELDLIFAGHPGAILNAIRMQG
jgi:MoaA/NifB/PqqE/SkfB family radical SAM enzyme